MSSKISTVFSYPKINLALDVLQKTPSGYHEIQTILVELKNLRDEIIIEPLDDGKIEIICDNPLLPTDESNSVFIALQLVKKELPDFSGARIIIKKNIPISAGLGGHSSNAVAVLKHYVQNKKHLYDLARQISMDAAFFVEGGVACGTHFGEEIEKLPELPPDISFEILETGVQILSRDAYEWLDLEQCGQDVKKTAVLIGAIRNQNSAGILENIHNDFESAVFQKYPQLAEKKREIEEKLPGKVILCGSGGSLVRIYS